MKVLLDECITKRLKSKLDIFDVYTVSDLGWSGVKNGNLMKLCLDNHFDVLLTIDKNMVYQQNIKKYPLSIVVFNSLTSKIEELVLFIPSFIRQSTDFEKYKTYIIEKDF
jgi:predicted nuclease of predicted toxin-antitoxin system